MYWNKKGNYKESKKFPAIITHIYWFHLPIKKKIRDEKYISKNSFYETDTHIRVPIKVSPWKMPKTVIKMLVVLIWKYDTISWYTLFVTISCYYSPPRAYYNF